MLSLAIVTFFSTLALAQQGTPAPGNSGPMGRRMMGGQMMMGQMTTQHQEMSQLMSKMMQSMTAINAEKDPAKLKALLAEHAALMDQMHAKMMSQGNMMHDMAGQMKNCPAMGDTSK
jgi:NADH pyrophosphatase NudC (nudix superfamily)